MKKFLLTPFIFFIGVLFSSESKTTWFGDPNLQGTWSNQSLTSLERPDEIEGLIISDQDAARYAYYYQQFLEAADGEFEVGEEIQAADDPGGYNTEWMDPGTQLLKIENNYRSSVITYPEDGKLPRKLWRWAINGPLTIYKMFVRADHPEERSLGERCIVGFGSSGGPPMLNVLYNNNYQIVQSPGYVVILVEMNHDARIIKIDGKHNPETMKPWLGDSIGYWEGETLVVKTKNMHPQQQFRAGIRHQIFISENALIEERFTRTSQDEILYQFIVNDEKFYNDAWKGEMLFRKTDGKIYEYACHEGNYAMENILAGARALENQ